MHNKILSVRNMNINYRLTIIEDTNCVHFSVFYSFHFNNIYFFYLSTNQINFRWSMRAGGTTSPSLQSSWTQ